MLLAHTVVPYVQNVFCTFAVAENILSYLFFFHFDYRIPFFSLERDTVTHTVWYINLGLVAIGYSVAT
jgi:hypothetical protein